MDTATTSQPPAVLYTRISKDTLGEGAGVARQERECRALATRLGWEVAEVYSDNDVSAYNGKRRPGFEALLEAMHAGQVHRVIVWHHDRLTRSPKDLERYLDASEPMRVQTHTVAAGPIDLTTPSGRAMARTLVAWARYESEHKADRQRAKERETAMNGALTGGPRPYGWQKDRLRLEPVEHEVIVEMAERLLAGDSLREIARDLNSRGLRTSTGKLWQPSIIRAMLRRPRMAGMREYRGEIVNRNAAWEAALPESTWRELVALLNDPVRRTGTNSRRWLLTGIARCGVCNVPLSLLVGAKSRPETSRVAYLCPQCGISRAAMPLDAYVSGAVVRRLEALPAPPPSDADPALLAETERLKTKLAEVAAAFADDLVTMEQMTTTTRLVREQLAAVERKLVPPRRRAVLAGLGDARRTWDGLSLARKRAIVAELIEVLILPVGPHAPRRFSTESVVLRWL